MAKSACVVLQPKNKKSALAARQSGQPQRGAALLIFMIILVMGAMTYLVNTITPEVVDALRQQKAESVLTEARDALLGYAIQYREQQNASDIRAGNLPSNPVYGYLPLPDLGTLRNNNAVDANCNGLEGCEAYNFAGNGANVTVIGRFPWRKLGLPPLRDGSGECLWYAVSGSHQRNQISPPMNGDTLGHLDGVVVTAGALAAEGLQGHDRPVAIIFSPGSALASRTASASTVTECGGSYVVSEYLEAMNLAPAFGSTNGASGDASAQAKPFSAKGKVFSNTSPPALLANDVGLPITSDTLFGAIRKSLRFRDDINQMVERIAECARDQVAAGGSGNALVNDACSINLDTFGPPGYYASYRDQVFVTSCASCQVTVDNVLTPSCAGALLFANQRGSGQNRRDAADKAVMSNYLEGSNLTSYGSGGNMYAGPGKLLRESATPPIQSKNQDIVRCIAPGASMTAATSALPAGSELSQYDPATRTITLGRAGVDSSTVTANMLFGCIWQTDTHATGSGFRSYFQFNITDRGDGFTFAAIDGDRNTGNVCGAGEQHLGFSGNNSYTTPIAYPKIGVEIDTRRNYQSNLAFLPLGFNPARIINATTLRTLANGRVDPNYPGGHIGLVYWGGETPISTGYACNPAICRSPSFCDTDNICKLNQEEDDNVHGQLPVAPASRPPPRNPVAPVTPPTNPPYPPYGVDKLDPSLSAVPTNQTIHMRAEVQRSYAGRDDNSQLVRLVVDTNIAALSGLPTIDGVAVQAGDTVLVAAQAVTTTNGVYIAAAGAWARATTANETLEFAPGTSWFVKEGTAYTGSLWRLQNTETPILGISPLDIHIYRAAVKSVATGNTSKSGLAAVGGYTPQAGDRILLAGQTDATQNGVWIAATGAWQRAAPESSPSGLKDGSMWYVVGGSNAGTYWRLNGDVTTLETSSVSIAQATTNDLYAARITTQVWKETSNANQIARMKMTTSAMNELDPVVRYGTCDAGVCPAANPVGQSCGGTETDGHRYCYTGQKPKLYDSQKIYDTRGSACSSGASCAAGQFCGIDNYCYQPALRTMRLGFTTSQSTQSQVISIGDFFTSWLQ